MAPCQDRAEASFEGSTAPGTLRAVITGGPTTFDVAVSGMTGSGTVVASVSDGWAFDAAGNSNEESTSTDNSVQFNAPPAPSVTINQAGGQADPTSTRPVNFTVTFSSSVTGFTGNDVSFTGSTAPGTLSAVVTGGPSTYNVAVSGMTGGGTVVVSVPANAVDGGNAASTSTDNTVTFRWPPGRPSSAAARPGCSRTEPRPDRPTPARSPTGPRRSPAVGRLGRERNQDTGHVLGRRVQASQHQQRRRARRHLRLRRPPRLPVAGDFNGDGVDDIAVYRDGLWQLRYSTGETPPTFRLGSGSWPSTVPMAGAWDGDGTDGVGVFVAGTWTLRSLASAAGVDSMVTFGPGTSPYPVVGDWNGDGIDTVGVKAVTGTTWRLTNSMGSAPPVEITFDFRQANTDLPLTWR